MIINDIENQIVSEQFQSGLLYIVCKDSDTGTFQKYIAVRSEQDRSFWKLVKHGKPILNKKSEYRKTMDKIYSILNLQ